MISIMSWAEYELLEAMRLEKFVEVLGVSVGQFIEVVQLMSLRVMILQFYLAIGSSELASSVKTLLHTDSDR